MHRHTTYSTQFPSKPLPFTLSFQLLYMLVSCPGAAMSFRRSLFQPIYKFHFWVTGAGNNSGGLHSVDILRNNWGCSGVLHRTDEHILCSPFESTSSPFLNRDELPVCQTRLPRAQLQLRRHTQYFNYRHVSSQAQRRLKGYLFQRDSLVLSIFTLRKEE